MDMKKTAAKVKAAITESDKESKKRFDWLKEYIKLGANSSHIAAGQALASAVMTAAVLDAPQDIISGLLYNPREGQLGREDFRFDFARHALLCLLNGYENDDLVSLKTQIDAASGAGLISILLEALAYESGQLAEDIQFPG